MAEHTRSERVPDGAELGAAALERGKEHLEGVKAQLADGAERVAAAVDRTADGLDEGDSPLSGFGHSIASLMRQLSGGLRERDVDDFARELGQLARRNPGVFLAGSVALGFGVARFFKARPPATQSGRQWQGDGQWQDSGRQNSGRQDWSGPDTSWQDSSGVRSSQPRAEINEELDREERLDLSANSMRRRANGDAEQTIASADDESDPIDPSTDEPKGGQS